MPTNAASKMLYMPARIQFWKAQIPLSSGSQSSSKKYLRHPTSPFYKTGTHWWCHLCCWCSEDIPASSTADQHRWRPLGKHTCLSSGFTVQPQLYDH